MKPYDLCRTPAGSHVIYDCEAAADRETINSRLSGAAAKTGAKLQRLSINGFDSNNVPHYLLRVTVIKPGAPKKNQRGTRP